MATISSPGIGSGLDVGSIISQLMAIERAPKDKLAADATKTQTQISEVGKITSAVSKLRDLASKLSSSGFWQQTAATSSNASAVSVTSSSSAAASNYAVNVTQLAKSQSVVAGTTFTSATAFVGTGTLTLDMGSWDATQTTFTPRDPPAAASLAIEATDTVESLRDKINAAGLGVTASILTDASGARLVMRSKETGAVNGFAVGVTGATGDLASLAYPASGTKTATLNNPASDASATINGLAVTSASNSLTNVLDGVSLTLNATTTSEVTINIASDTEAMKKTLQEFATAYSDIVRTISTNTKYDAASKKAGPLQGDNAIVGVLSRMRGILGMNSGASPAFPRLSDIGFEQQRDGSLTVNETRLKNALSNLTELRKAFSNTDTGDGSMDGFARRFKAMADSLLNTDGTLSSRSDGLNEKLRRNQKNQEALEQRLVQTQKRLETQYRSLDTKLSMSNGLSSYVSQQISQWNRVA
jgi:flagellar hook-associated protein 2